MSRRLRDQAIVPVIAVTAVAWRVWAPSQNVRVPVPGSDPVPGGERLPAITTECASGGELVLSVDHRLLATHFVEAEPDQQTAVMVRNEAR